MLPLNFICLSLTDKKIQVVRPPIQKRHSKIGITEGSHVLVRPLGTSLASWLGKTCVIKSLQVGEWLLSSVDLQAGCVAWAIHVSQAIELLQLHLSVHAPFWRFNYRLHCLPTH